MLSTYFQSHNFYNLSVFVFLLVAWEICGTGLINHFRLKPPEFLRPAYWLVGMGLTALGVFVLHLTYPLKPYLIYLIVIFLSYPFSRHYLTNRDYRSYVFLLKKNLLFMLILIPIVPYLFIKTSLPPYVWDEMAYHYYSPYRLQNEITWAFGGLYQNLPRLLETIFVAAFSLSKTYATARLIHTSIFITAVFCLYLFFKHRVGKLAGLLVSVLLIHFSPQLVLESTYGYVDIGTASFLLLTFLLLFEFILQPRKSLILLMAIYGAIALGSKYTSLSTLTSLRLLIMVISLRSIEVRKVLFKRNLIFISFGVLIIFGGYWYLKNFLVTGNPIYPFFLPCRNEDCSAYNQSFFSWAIPFGWQTFPRIYRVLSVSFLPSIWLTLPVLSFGFVFSNSRLRKLILFFLSILLIDLLISSRVSGFEARYFFHWRFINLILIAVSAYSLGKLVWRRIPLQVLLIVLIPITLIGVFYATKLFGSVYRLYLPDGNAYFETRYALGRMPIFDWVRRVNPKTAEIVFWCDRQSKAQYLATKDPDLLWFTAEAQHHIFLTNCNNDGFEPDMPHLYFSLDDCSNPEVAPKRNPYESDAIYQMRLENREIICQSIPVVKSLYLSLPD